MSIFLKESRLSKLRGPYELNRGTSLWDGLRNFWLFNQGAGIKVRDLVRPHLFDLNINGTGVTWGPLNDPVAFNGLGSDGLKFAGGSNDYLVQQTTGNADGNFGVLNGVHLFTVAVRFRATGVSTRQTLISHNNATNSFMVEIGPAGGQVAAGNISTAIPGVFQTITNSNQLVAGVWYTLVITYNNTVERFYLNGTEVTSYFQQNTPNYDNLSNLLIGARANNSQIFSGAMAYVAMWNRLLRLDEVRAVWSDLGVLLRPAPARAVMLGTDSGTQSYVYVPSGGISFAGDATTSRRRNYAYVSSGGEQFGGSAGSSVSITRAYTGSGGLVFGGAAATRVSKRIEGTFTCNMVMSQTWQSRQTITGRFVCNMVMGSIWMSQLKASGRFNMDFRMDQLWIGSIGGVGIPGFLAGDVEVTDLGGDDGGTIGGGGLMF